MLAQKRVTKDFRDFLKAPIPGCHVCMREDNVLVWDAVIQWTIDDSTVVPFHMVIAFPDAYPTAAPKVGFSCHNFGYQNGASK
jgi:ubiquitin-protein ligase